MSLPVLLRSKIQATSSIWSHKYFDTVEEAKAYVEMRRGHSVAANDYGVFEIHELHCKARYAPNSMETFNAQMDLASGASEAEDAGSEKVSGSA